MGPKAKVLVLDDDKLVLKAVSEVLRRDGYDVLALADPLEAIATAKDPAIDVVVSDIRMPNLSGLDVLKAFKQAQPDVEVILMTGHASLETAVEAVKAGAYDFLAKPFERIEDFSLRVAKAAERRALKKRTRQLEEALETKASLEGMIGQSAQMRAVFRLIETVGPTTATVLIQGESGTGKELVSRAIHFKSDRKDKVFVAVNCSALTETLLESELFGHVKGAFTGAIGNKKGLFEAADGGTLFLDEIGDVPPATQVRLLRVLQEGELKRVGGNETVNVDVRVIAASNVDLAKAKAEGRFREDLYYRLNVITVALPALRDRPDDVPILAHHFLRRYAEKMKKQITGITPEAMGLLTLHRWPGNVRELENVIERASVLCSKTVIDAADLPEDVKTSPKTGASGVDAFNLNHLPLAQAKELAIRAFERSYLTVAMDRNNQNVSASALAAGMDRSNFRRLLKQHGIGGRGVGGVDGGPDEA